MERTLDARGLACPLPLVKARAALAGLGPGDALVVLATDPEAPIDLAALAADDGRASPPRARRAHWRLVLGPEIGSSPAPPHARGGAGRPATT